MGGRFQGTGRGSGGRNAGRGNANGGRGSGAFNNKKTNAPEKKKEKKFHPLTRGKIPECSFQEVKKELILKISNTKMDYVDDMIASVMDMNLFDLETVKPTLKLITDDKDPDKDEKNEQAKADYAADRKDHRYRKVAFDNNKRKLHGTIITLCTEYMKDKLGREIDWETDLFDNPIELLKRIEKFMTTTADTEWEYFRLWETMGKMLNCKQKEKESVNDFRNRFEETAKGVKSLIGDDALEHFVKTTQEYKLITDAGDQVTHVGEAWDRFIANGLMFNSDRAKYQSRIDAMTAQYALKHLEFKQRCTFPTTIENAAEVLHLHKHDNRNKKPQGGGGKNKNGGTTGGNNTNGNGNQNGGSQFSQQGKRKCFVCGSEDHVSPFCPDKFKPREQWKKPERYVDYRTRDQQHVQQGGQGSNGSNQSNDSSTAGGSGTGSSTGPRVQWRYTPNGGTNGQYVQRGEDTPPDGVMLYQRQERSDPDHLDSGSTFNLRKYREGLRYLRRITGGFRYDSNAGAKHLEEEGLDNFDLWAKLDEGAMENITSISLLVKNGYRVFMDTARNNSFFVTNNGRIWRYGHRNGLYTRVEEPEMLSWSFYAIATGEDLDGVDPRVQNLAQEHRTVANRLQSERESYGEVMDRYYDQWLYNKFWCWIMELAVRRRRDLESVGILDDNEFLDQAIREGIDKDQHEWANGDCFVFNLERMMQRNYPGQEPGQEVNVEPVQRMDENGFPIILNGHDDDQDEDQDNLVHNILDEDSVQGYSNLQTVEKNKEGFTKRQVERANKARSGYHMMGAIDPKLFKLAIRGNFFKNCPITEADIDVAEKIYGPSASTFKGKTKRKTPQAVVDDWIEIPKELLESNEKLDLCIDIMFINNVALFVSIDKSIKFRFCTDLESRTKDAIYKAIDKILRTYNHAEFTIRTIYCDNEFKSVFDDVKDDMGVTMNYAAPGEHEPTIERNNQTLKALFRTHYHRMVYKAIPKVLTIALIKHVTKVINFYPAKGGISQHYSPQVIVNRRPVDWEKECVAEIGAYVQGYGHETNNSQRTRTIDGIYLGPTENIQGSHVLLDLNTRKTVTRARVSVLPITKQVIKLVEEMAHDEGVRDLRTYHWKNGEIILDGDLLAGVDPDELWDEIYLPQENEYKRSDDMLRNEHIDQEEIDELYEDAEELLGNVKKFQRENPNRVLIENEEEPREDRSVASIYERRELRNQQEMSEQNDDPNDTDMLTDGELEEQIRDVESEIGRINDELEQLNDDEPDATGTEESNSHGETNDLIARIEEQVGKCEEEVENITDYIENLDNNENEESNETENESNDSDHEMNKDESDEEEEVAEEGNKSPRRTRSGRAYMQDGIKMRPTERNNRDRPRYNQQYLNRKKVKPNSQKNRSAMRKKEKAKRLSNCLKNLISIKEKTRQQRRKIESKYNLCFSQIGKQSKVQYGMDNAVLVARFMHQIKENVRNHGFQFVQQYYLNKGLKIFKDDGDKAAMGELEQLVERNCWEPIHIEEMNDLERERAQDAMMLLSEKNDGEVKGRCVYKGDGTREWLSREDTSSPTASLEAIATTCVIDAYEGRDMMSLDIPNAFIQTPMDANSRVMMKITGLLVDMMIRLDPSYRNYVVMENGKRVIYVRVLRAIYGMLEASMLWYKKLRGDLEAEGFEFNPYDGCVANKIVNGNQQTIRFHVDDLLSSHIDPKVNDEFFDWMSRTYGSIKPVKSTRGKVHKYLGMTLDFRKKGKVKIRMDEYVERMLTEFPIKFKEGQGVATPATSDLLCIGKGEKLDDEKREIFHTFVAKGLFLSKRARLDIAPTISVLATRVQGPNESDWKKLVRLMRYLNGTKSMHLTMSAKDLKTIKWYIDASFAVHPDFKSHTGAVMTMGEGAMQTLSRKQKLNSRSSTEAELIGVDDGATQVLWTKLFTEAQGYPVEDNIVYQDNKSSILLEKNGRDSAGKRSRAINIRYFFMTDQVKKGNVTIEYCSTDDMWGDFMSKPLQGEKFRKFRSLIQGEQD